MVGVPCSNDIETEIMTALSEALGRMELSSFTPSTRFPDSSLALWLPLFEHEGAYPGVAIVSSACSGPYSPMSQKGVPPFSAWWGNLWHNGPGRHIRSI